MQNMTLITVPETAKRLGLGKTFTYELIEQSQIPVVRLGKRVMVPIKYLNLYIETLVEWPKGFSPAKIEVYNTSIPLAQEKKVGCK